ncbi:hypothetical protein AX15_003557 [Amanita polypyramis BW_CC]|nr:hypothetical protein AX15_003557 [Amanita polypyramis BW_CC]
MSANDYYGKPAQSGYYPPPPGESSYSISTTLFARARSSGSVPGTRVLHQANTILNNPNKRTRVTVVLAKAMPLNLNHSQYMCNKHHPRTPEEAARVWLV